MIEARAGANRPPTNDFHPDSNTKCEASLLISPETPQSRAPSWSLVCDLCLELQAAREELARVDADLADQIAYRRHSFYVLVGGTQKTVAMFRAETRLELPELLGRRVDPPPLNYLDSPPPSLPRRKGRRKVIGSC